MNVPPNAQNLPHENEGPNILAATLTVTIVALLTFATRLYVRLRIIRNVGWDDYVMAFVMVLVGRRAIHHLVGSDSVAVYCRPMSHHPRGLLWRWEAHLGYSVSPFFRVVQAQLHNTAHLPHCHMRRQNIHRFLPAALRRDPILQENNHRHHA